LKGIGNMRVMAIDYGDTRTGVAFSDKTGTLTGETFVVKAYSPEKTIEEMMKLIAEKSPSVVVVGYPKNMNGTIGPRAEKSEEFANLLRDKSGLKVELRDERLTTVDAHRILSDTGRNGKKRKNTVDAVAASLILENYLSELKNS
jgi:putative Holliday junction resolvase